MTDEESQRQRHLAEMLIAQCDGKQVQFKHQNELWRDLAIPLIECELACRGFRIKPEPREWWVCETCNGRMPVGSRCHGKNSKDGFLKCDEKLIHVREVLEP